MKTAHQGVPVAGLPGLSSGPLTAGLPPFGGGADDAARAAARIRKARSKPASADGGIDNWLIDRLFGRR